MSTNGTALIYLKPSSWTFQSDREPLNLSRTLVHIFLAGTIVLFLSSFRSGARVNAPFIGYRSKWEPTFLVRLRFIFESWNIIQDGYRRYYDRLFYLRTVDADFLILPTRYLEELKAVSRDVLSNTEAQVKNTAGKWTDTKDILQSDLHLKALKNHITPNLHRIMADVRDELDYAWEADMKETEDWIEFDIQSLLRRVVARLSGRLFVGPACRSETWIQTSADYTVNLFKTAFLLHQVPLFLRSFVASLLPARYAMFRNVRNIQDVITPLMETYSEAVAAGKRDTQPTTILNAMIDDAVGQEAHPTEMAKRQALLTLASIHTTSTTLSHAIFDLCIHPEYAKELTEEIDEYMSASKDWAKQSLVKLQKLDSFIVESMRMHPPSFLLPTRVVLKPLQLSDGTDIPVNTRIGFAIAGVVRDPKIFPRPDEFDGYRSYRKRQEEGHSQKHLLVMPDESHLVFGYGKQACPGRFFAVNEMKLIFSRLLQCYEMKLPEGKGSPKCGCVGEFPVLDPKATVMIRQRRR